MNFEEIVDKDFSGCISVVKNVSVIFEKSYRYTDLSNKIDVKFATASAGTVFVAVGIMKLIKGGRLDFDDEIGNLLDFDLKAIDKRITVKQLLEF